MIHLHYMTFCFLKSRFQLSLQPLKLLVSEICLLCKLSAALWAHYLPLAHSTEWCGSWVFIFLLVNCPVESLTVTEALACTEGWTTVEQSNLEHLL